MDDRVYWVWLQQALKYANNKINNINLLFNNIKNFYELGSYEWKLSGLFNSKEIVNLNSFNIDKAYLIIEKCKKYNYKILNISSNNYPEKLKNISNPPCVLYIKGTLPDINNNLCISVVGTRKATVYGVQMASEICTELAKNEIIIASGGALGVDRAAHRGAIEGGGKTIAVLGCGLNYPYLLENALLRNTISQNGALVSEYPPDYPVYISNFPIRNRIISGLSSGTVIIEAGEKSGSLITANLAAEQGRDVFVVPVDMRSSVSKGSVSLIRDGAKIITCADDIINEYNNIYFDNKKNNFIAKNIDNKYNNNIVINDISEPAKKIYEIFKINKKIHIDELSIISKIKTRDLLSIITELEILGLIESYSGRIYGIK